MNIKKEDCFFELKGNGKVIQNWFKNPRRRPRWLSVFPTLSVLNVPKKIWSQESTLTKIHSLFKIQRVSVLRQTPKSELAFHCDTMRDVCINMLLTPEIDSICCFRETMNFDVVEELLELKYKPNSWYMFNTQVPHAVANNSDQMRYVITVDLELKLKDIPFDKVRSVLKKSKISRRS